MKCVQCGASLSADSNYCSHCGSRNDIDLTLINTFTVVAPETERLCPECGRPMQTVDVGKENPFLIEQCPEYHGLFFDSNELESLLDNLVKNVYTVDYTRLETGNREFFVRTDFRYRPCPVCRRLMNRKNFGVRSGVVVDSCRDHGIWLDAGKFRQLCEWKKAGGQLLPEPAHVDHVPGKENTASAAIVIPAVSATPVFSLFSSSRRYWIVVQQVSNRYRAECPDIPGLAAEEADEETAVMALTKQIHAKLLALRERGGLTPPARTRCREILLDPDPTKP